MGRATDIQDKDQNVSIDIDFRIIGTTLTVTDFQLFRTDDRGGWIEVRDSKLARELYEKYNGDQLIHDHFEFKPDPYFEYVAS